MSTDHPPVADAQLCLHALKTAAATKHFLAKCPDRPVCVYLTGTDLHGGIAADPELATEVCSLAARLVVAHPECVPYIPAPWRDKAVVIYPSVDLPALVEIDVPKQPLFTNVGHLRAIKNPHLMFAALQNIPQKVIAYSIGNALTDVDRDQALSNATADSRYRWLADCDRATALGWMQQSIATINTSLAEGGANTILEAIHLGVPVLASNIAGNRGLLGKDYEGLFESNNAAELAALMIRCLHEPSFLKKLCGQLEKRKPLFSQARETRSLEQLIGNI